jgi:nucleotide-binding universal stress UspA family protein
MKHILVTTDFSNAAAVAYAEARAVAKAAGVKECHLSLLYLSEDIVSATFGFGIGLDPEAIHLDLEREAREELDRIEEEYFSDLLITKVVIRATEPVPIEIARFARTHRIDMIITATHGRSGIEHFLLGSVAEKLLRLAPCPILVVPSRARDDEK